MAQPWSESTWPPPWSRWHDSVYREPAFTEGDAESLPFNDGEFDAVICCFGLLHFADPARALREVARVLKPGGIVSFTVWHSPQNGGEFFGLVLGTYEKLANMNVGLPLAPPMFGLADAGVRDPMLAQAGFEDIRAKDIAITWPLRAPEAIIEFVLKGAVRTRMVYERQTPEIQQRIREALATATKAYLQKGNSGIPNAALLVTARKP